MLSLAQELQQFSLLVELLVELISCEGSHYCFGPPFLFVEGLLSTGPTPSNFYLLVDMDLPLHFLSKHVVRTRPALYIKTTP